MPLSASIALSNILLSLVVALVTSSGIGINDTGGVKKNHMSQSHISFNPDGSMRNWEYCPMVARTELVRLLARLDVPISMGETDAFEEYIRTAHNPKYVPVSRQTTTRDMVKFFTDRKAKPIENLSSSTINYVCLTSNIWSGNAKED